MLGIFLEVDREADSKADEKALRGVRKAQVKLPPTYLVHGPPVRAAAFLTTCAPRAPSVSPHPRRNACAFTPRISGKSRIAALTFTTSTIPQGEA